MKKFDGRRLSHEALEQIRINAVQRVEAGESPEEVIKSIGFERVCIYRWLASYRWGGFDALRAKKLNGRPPILSGEQLMKLYKVITEEDPRQYQFPFALWTVSIVRDVIRNIFGVKMSAVSVWRTLKKLGLTPQRPLRRAYQQNREAVDEFLQVEYPKIRARAKRVGASIYWEDESAIRSDYHSGTTWAQKGKTPVVEATGARFKVNMISAVDARGSLRFMVIEGTFNADRFIEFLRRLIAGREKPVFLIVDGHPAHKAKKVKQFVAEHAKLLELYYLPGYSPELNPDEQVWNYVKNHTVGKMAIKGPQQLKKAVQSTLRRLARMPHLVRSFFNAPELQYAMY
jgi:transposase